MSDTAALTDFLATRDKAVIATASPDAKPEAAYVAYVSNPEIGVIIGTSNQSRKFKNISENRSVALVVADDSGEVQYEGEVTTISQADYEALMADGTFGELSGFDKYRNDPTQVYLRLRPTWVRYITHGEPDVITEFTEFA